MGWLTVGWLANGGVAVQLTNILTGCNYSQEKPQKSGYATDNSLKKNKNKQDHHVLSHTDNTWDNKTFVIRTNSEIANQLVETSQGSSEVECPNSQGQRQWLRQRWPWKGGTTLKGNKPPKPWLGPLALLSLDTSLTQSSLLHWYSIHQ